MKLATSYLGNYRNFKDYIPVCIMRWKPHYFNGIHIPELSPSAEILNKYKNNLMTFEDFKDNMQSQLNKFDINKILIKLQSYNEEKLVLVCTCKDYNKCHRKIVAGWIIKSTGLIIEEL